MAGKKNRYIYILLQDGVEKDRGSAKYLADKYYTDQMNLFACYRNNGKFLRIYNVDRIRAEWKPTHGSIYYYTTTNGNVQSRCFDEFNKMDLFRFNFGDCFETKEEAKENEPRIYEKLRSKYLNT